MSRIGKQPIELPQGVEVAIKDNIVTFKGPKGELTQEIPDEILVEKKENQLIVSEKRKTKKSSAFWGLIRALLQNCVLGVTKGFEKKT